MLYLPIDYFEEFERKQLVIWKYLTKKPGQTRDSKWRKVTVMSKEYSDLWCLLPT